MEVPLVVSARSHGEPIKRRQEEQPDHNDEEQQHTGSGKRLRASGEEDLQGAPSRCSGSTALSSPAGESGDSAGEVVLPCTGDEGALQAQGGPKTSIVEENNDEEEQSELEFEKETALIRAEIARLEALVERLESQAGRK